ncbi:hypothetical protein [Gayadomonas joobiniege]|uniref:hypothetical protein n=1 Tax=Gayadomonas joobiniege TaxID=1234606 RepID=UPI000378B43F|nr:hypothetical protein [Gayadomonas joobiniege]
MKVIISGYQNKISMCAVQNQSVDYHLKFWANVAKQQVKNKWLCVVAPFNMPSKEQLTQIGVDIDRLLMIHQKSSEALQTAKKAAAAGKCSCVVAWVNQLPKQHELLSDSHQCSLVVIKDDQAIAANKRLTQSGAA